MERKPSPEAIAAARVVARRLKGRNHAPIRRQFVERRNADSPTPLARILRGGRGGAVRLKLELSMLWFAAAPPHTVAYPARAWAELLDLNDPAGRGARRIHDAVLWLEANQLIAVEARAGQPNLITMLAETGSGAPYELPGAAYNRLRRTPEGAHAHRYLQLPSELWTSGWLATLSGAALAMLLVLYAEGSGKTATTDLWFSPQQADLRYGLSEDTRAKGLRELRAAELISARRQSVAPDTFDFRRLRNVYRLEPGRLHDPAVIPDSPPKAPDSPVNGPLSTAFLDLEAADLPLENLFGAGAEA